MYSCRHPVRIGCVRNKQTRGTGYGMPAAVVPGGRKRSISELRLGNLRRDQGLVLSGATFFVLLFWLAKEWVVPSCQGLDVSVESKCSADFVGLKNSDGDFFAYVFAGQNGMGVAKG